MAHSLSTSNNNKDECSSGACPVDKPRDSKLIKATELPITGNPYPPRDVIIEDNPNMLELKVRSVRQTIQPYLSPIFSAYERVSDIAATGAAHSQSAIHRLSENRNSLANAVVISGAGLVGIALARRRGFFRKLLFGSLFFGAATALCYPKEVEERAQVLMYIAKNKFPVVAKQQYDKLLNLSTTSGRAEQSEIAESQKQDTK